MKAFSRLLVILIIVVFTTGMQFSSVWAISYNPAAEEYVKNEILASGDADLEKAFPNASDRAVRADFIVSLWKDPTFQVLPFFKLRNAIILGDIKAERLTIPFDVEFWACKFDGRIEMSRANIQSFGMYDSIVTGAVRMGRLTAQGDLALYTSIYEGGVVLYKANIGGNLLARGSQFNAIEPDEGSFAPFELWKTQVGEITEFTNTMIKGEAKVDDAEFGIDVYFNDAIFEENASFRNVTVGNNASFQGAIFKNDFSFENSVVDRDTFFTGVTFHGNANFDYFSGRNFVYFDSTIFDNDFSLAYSILSWPYFWDATFNGSVDFEGMQTSNELDFSDSRYNYKDEPFTITLAKVDKAVKFNDFAALGGLVLENNLFGDLIISGKENQKFDFISLNSTTVAEGLVLENVNVDIFFADGFSAAKSSAFYNVSVIEALDLGDAHLGQLTLDQFVWPSDSWDFNLHGATYKDIRLMDHDSGEKNINRGNWERYFNIVQSSKFDPEVYKTFEQFLADKGLQDLIPEVELAKKRRERDYILVPYSSEWIWSWFLDIFAGYGQRPGRALLCSLLVIGAGAFVFRKESELVSLEKPEAMPPYNPILYSFALFIPFIDLGIADKWNPKPGRKGGWLYKHFHKMMGWILMPVAILTFGGFIK